MSNPQVQTETAGALADINAAFKVEVLSLKFVKPTVRVLNGYWSLASSPSGC